MTAPSVDPEALAEKLAYWRRHGAPGRIRPGRDRVSPVRHDQTGDVVGHATETWDGRVHAISHRQDIVENPRFFDHVAAARGEEGHE